MGIINNWPDINHIGDPYNDYDGMITIELRGNSQAHFRMNIDGVAPYYPFNEGHGDTAYDYSSYALEANFNGNVKWNANGEEIPTFFTSISSN